MQPRAPEKTPRDRRNCRNVKDNYVPRKVVYLAYNNYLAKLMYSQDYVQLYTDE